MLNASPLLFICESPHTKTEQFLDFSVRLELGKDAPTTRRYFGGVGFCVVRALSKARPVSVDTLNYRSVLSSERAPNRKNIKTIVTKERKG
jgi:hypothetical protein